MINTRLITAAQVHKVTPVKNSVDKDIVNPAIITTQDTVLAYILGASLLQALQVHVEEKYVNDSSGKYQLLMERYVAPYLCWATAYQLLPNIAYDIGGGGINTQDSNQGTAVFEGSMAVIKQNILGTSASYKTLLLDFLCNNSSDYPEYNQVINGEQKKQDSGKPFWGVQMY